MRWSQQSRRGRSLHRAVVPICLIDALESRRLLSGESVPTPIPAVLANAADPSANNITLNQYFTDDVLPGTLATFDTNEGDIQVALTDAATPQTVANFLSYVSSGAYSDTIFHRSVDLSTGLGGEPEAPATIIQGGGYDISGGSFAHIATNAPVADEYTTEVLHDTAGTLAMAKTSQADSATSEWYFNVSDNTELDQPTTDSNGIETSYTVFGNVLSGMNVIDAIAALPTYNDGSGLDTIPVNGITEAQANAGVTISASNLIFTTSITSEPGTSYTVSSSNKALVSPVVTNGVLSFTYSPTLFGTAEITITGSNLDGTNASTVLDVTVPNPATPSAGPVAANVTAPFTQTGTTGNFSVVADDTDSVAALNPASVTIVTGPTNGTASVDVLTGHINYTPNTGYLGADSLTYTVADANGTVSNIATVTLDAVSGPVTVNIGSAKAKSLTFTEPDGVVSHLTIAAGTAEITFADYRVDLKTVNGTVFASGAGTTITGITVTDKVTAATLSITSNGPVQIGPIQDRFHLIINAPDVTLTGASVIGSSDLVNIAALSNATLSFSSSPVGIVLLVPTVTNSSITSAGGFNLIRSKNWFSTDGAVHVISAPAILDLEVTGTFQENLSLTSKNYSLYRANVGTATGGWNTSGSIHTLIMNTPGADWSLNCNGLASSVTIKGNLANNLEAAAIGTMTVSGTSTGSTIQTDANFSKKFVQIVKIAFGGAVSNTVVFSAGNIGAITAASMTNSRIYAGVSLTIAEDGELAASTADFTNDARIASVSVGNGTAAFTNCLISGDIIGSLKLGKVDTSNNGTTEGISAHTISSITATLVPGGNLKPSAAQLKTAATLAAYIKLEKLTLGDFKVNLF